MKKLLIIFFITLGLLTFNTRAVHAQMMGFSGSSPDNAAIQSQKQEEREGKKFLDNLNNKTVTCSELKDADFEKIGEHFMGQSIGDTSKHITMNEMMKSMMGDKGEEQMHITLGKRSSGCDTNTSFPSQGTGIMPMTWMMGYDAWGGFGFGWIFMIIFWILIILGVVALVRYLGNSGKTTKDDKTPLEILKERYAKGEIDKKEFEEMKKDLK